MGIHHHARGDSVAVHIAVHKAGSRGCRAHAGLILESDISEIFLINGIDLEIILREKIIQLREIRELEKTPF